MPFPSKKLKVHPNPWVYIDHLGRPAGRLPFDGFEHSQSPGSVGASITDVKQIQSAMVMRVAGRDLEVNPAQHDTRITYSKDAVEIPNTAYYRDALRRLDLVSADKETAQEAGLKFEDPAKVLAKYKDEAIERFNAETAEDAYARFGAVEPLYTASAQATVQAPAKVEPAKGDK
jgi:hypothetical protein